MSTLWELFMAFLIPSVVGYGGGPASIPLIEHEVVNRYGFMTTSQFGEVLALANSLPGPIATKMAGYIGYEVGGVAGLIVALIATIVPSLIAIIVLMRVFNRFKDSPKVKRMSMLVRPTIVVLLAILTFQFFETSVISSGAIQTILIGGISFILLERFNVHPAFVVASALLYGAIFLS